MLARPGAPLAQFNAWLKLLSGVDDARVNSACAAVVVTFDPEGKIDAAAIQASIEGVDLERFRSAPLGGPENSGTQPSWFSFILSSTGQSPRLAIASAGLLFSLLPGPLFAGSSIAFSVMAAVPSFKRAAATLRDERRLNVDFLDSLAICISTLQGNLFTTAFMSWLIAVGDWIRDQTAAKSKRAIADLIDFQDKRAWVLRGKDKASIRVSEITPGDIVIAYDGDLIPVDGRVTGGSATVDQRAITGESMPIFKRRKDRVFGASIVQEGKLYVRAEGTASDSLAAQIVKAIEATPVGETRMQNYAEKFADWLVAPSLGLSTLLYLLTRDANRLLSTLIVDFGTGIRVAAPTSVLASISAAAKRGVLIRGGNTMERLAEVDVVVFDKTGTLTLGAPKITEVISYDVRRFPPRRILELAAASEQRLKHPVALATMVKARESQIRIPPRASFRQSIGRGVEAQVNGYCVHVGSERFLREIPVNTKSARNNCREANNNGLSSLMVAVEGELIGQLIYEDQLRAESAGVVRALRRRKVREIVMLTGDNTTVAHHVASDVGISTVHAEVLPKEKADIVKQFREKGRAVAMVGDGINDAVALASADVGVAMKNGSDLAQHSANVILLQDDLSKFVIAIDSARNALGLVHQNYSIVVGMNVAALALALLSRSVPAEAIALISNGSAIAASVNGLRPLLAPSVGSIQ